MIVPGETYNKRYDGDYNYPHTISPLSERYVQNSSTDITHLQLKFPSDALASVWPPNMEFNTQNPQIEVRLRMQGSITP